MYIRGVNGDKYILFHGHGFALSVDIHNNDRARDILPNVVWVERGGVGEKSERKEMKDMKMKRKSRETDKDT